MASMYLLEVTVNSNDEVIQCLYTSVDKAVDAADDVLGKLDIDINTRAVARNRLHTSRSWGCSQVDLSITTLELDPYPFPAPIN